MTAMHAGLLFRVSSTKQIGHWLYPSMETWRGIYVVHPRGTLFISRSVPISIHIYLPVEIGIHDRQSVRTLHHSPWFGVTHGYAAERLQAICFLQFLIRSPPALQN